MASGEEKYNRRRLNTSYITSIISITLVLFTLGFLGLIVINATILSNYIKENIGFEIIMKQDAREADIIYLQKILDAKNYVKSTEYITKEEAVQRLSEVLGEDFTGFLGEEDNPLLPSIDVRFNADWANSDSLALIEKFILSHDGVKEVYYQKSLVHLINRNLRRISFFLSGISILLLIITIALINNTIRLSVYSKRFIIRSMQLVGATRGFIRKPFMYRSILQGLISAILALAFLSGMIMLIWKNLPELQTITNPKMIFILYIFVVIIGILVSGISTFIVVNKYLRLKPDKLYG
jgi:cell division transport system permease protein